MLFIVPFKMGIQAANASACDMSKCFHRSGARGTRVEREVRAMQADAC
jgi:hypothetical protein